MKPYLQDADFTLYNCDVLNGLAQLPDESVHCVVTSPPYWGLRDYGTGTWEGGEGLECPACADSPITGRIDGNLCKRCMGTGEIHCDHKPEAKPARKFTNGRGEGRDDDYAGSNLTSWTYRDATVKDGGCPKGCGARRVDQQLGLEPTPEEYVARMVEVFREVRRVLRSDGTLWLNIGDSYAGSWGNQGRKDERGTQRPINGPMLQQLDGRYPQKESNTGAVPSGLKPKDLCMVPARLAMALQEPYYTGDIKSEADRSWLAAVVDSEGCIYISRSKTGATTGRGRQYVRTQDAFDAGVSVVNTSRALLERCVEITGLGKVRESHNRGTQAYEWRIYSNKARRLLVELYPHLVAKQDQARLAIACPPSGDDARKAWESLKAIHQGEKPCIDFAPPEGMWERGWFLRSDIIWSKPNPMPESVTDRPTKAHEYVFLLTKSPRYFFDQEAVREKYLDGPGLTGGAYNPPGQAPHSNARGPDGRAATRVLGADGSIQHRDGERWPNPSGRNVRSVWEIATQPYPEAHFATFPEELVRRCILAGTSERGCCPECGKPWVREVARDPDAPPSPSELHHRKHGHKPNASPRNPDRVDGGGMMQGGFGLPAFKTLGWRSGCDCVDEEQLADGSWSAPMLKQPVPCVVLDPFLGSGTTAYVARKHGRRSIGIELSLEYAKLAAKRMQQQSLFTEAA